MAVNNLFNNLTATQAAPGVAQSASSLGVPANVPPGSMAVAPGGGAGAPTQPTAGQEFQLVITGVGAVGGAATIFGSNDGVNWTSYVSCTATGGATATTGQIGGTTVWNWFTAQLTSIAGTSAAAQLTMST